MFYFNRIFNSTTAVLYNAFLSGLSLFILISLIFNNPNDPSLNVATAAHAKNILGFLGSYTSDLLLQNFGLISYLIPILIFLRAFFYFQETKKFSFKGLIIIFITLSILASIVSTIKTLEAWKYSNYGGIIGMVGNSFFVSFFKENAIFVKIFTLILSIFFLLMSDFEEFRSFIVARINFFKKKLHFVRVSKKFSNINTRVPSNKNEKKEEAIIDNQKNKNNILPKIKAFSSNLIDRIFRRKRIIKNNFHIDHYTKPNLLNIEKENFSIYRQNNNINEIYKEKNFLDIKSSEKVLESENLQGNQELYQSDFFKNQGVFAGQNSKADSQGQQDSFVKNIILETDSQEMIPVLNSKNTSSLVHKNDNHIQGDLPIEIPFENYKSPDLSLLQDTKSKNVIIDHKFALELSEKLIQVLEDFSIFGKILNYSVGPVITLFEFEPLPGTKSSRVIGLADDIARSLSSVSARISVIPGKNALGIELPNDVREIVLLKEILVMPEYQDNSMMLPIALGKNIAGLPIVVDLVKMPHLLVAGTTGSGKSVAINVFILSLLYKMKPDECKFIMIDPKMLELSVYNGIPHLLTPVVTDPKKAILVLKWVVKEMENRYKMMSYLGVRNLQNFNEKIEDAIKNENDLYKVINLGFDKGSGENITEKIIIEKKKLPYIVVIVDEMADLMLVAGKELEFYVQRIAQMARAAGIHIVMATQRPSVDVITGVIKANLPTRISFAVTNKIDSRTILGEQGAEQLLGMGDMLYMPSGGKITRIHGPFVSDQTVENVVNYLHQTSPPAYIDEILDEIESQDSKDSSGLGSQNENDFTGNSSGLDKEELLYRQALKIVFHEKKTSISYIQRQLRIGYNKSANLIERMEKEGVLSAPNHQGKREILKSEEMDE